MSESQNHCLVPVSLGELFDKYSILEIKSEKIANKDKVSMVNKELDYLRPFIQQYSLDNRVYTSLKKINEQLWDIEDKIRVKESLMEFDREFIDLARAVYKTNDKRCVVKNQINTLLHSELTDIKSYV